MGVDKDCRGSPSYSSRHHFYLGVGRGVADLSNALFSLTENGNRTSPVSLIGITAAPRELTRPARSFRS